MHRCQESATGTTSFVTRRCGTSIFGVLTRSVWCRAGSASTSIASGTSCPGTPRGSMKIRGSTLLPCTHDPHAMHDSFEQFGVLRQDAADNKALLANGGKITMP